MPQFLENAKAIVEFLSLIALIVYVVKTWEMASAATKSATLTAETLAEMRKTNDEESAPYVVVFFDAPIGKRLIDLVVKNTGKTVATDVHLEFEPRLQSSNQEYLDDLVFLKEGIKSMPPDYEIRTYLDTTIQYLNEPKFPLAYLVRVTFHGGLPSKERIIEYTLDLSAFKGRMWVTERGTPDLAASTETMAKSHEKVWRSLENISDRLSTGINITNPSLLISSTPTDKGEWERALINKLTEFAYLWRSANRQVPDSVDSLETRSLSISDHLVVILSSHSEDIESKLGQTAMRLAAQIKSLAHPMIYMDGDVSRNEWLARGDDIAREISQLVKNTPSVVTPSME
jgi:hypothetical protein